MITYKKEVESLYYHSNRCNPHSAPLYYWIHPTYYNYHAPFHYKRDYLQLDSTLFNESAIAMQHLMNEASIVLDKIANSKKFAHKIMTAAQQSHLDEVEQLIKSTGIHSEVVTSFNPDGINLKFTSKVESKDCCQLSIALRWRS